MNISSHQFISTPSLIIILHLNYYQKNIIHQIKII
jgi:hypothetical protein